MHKFFKKHQGKEFVHFRLHKAVDDQRIERVKYYHLFGKNLRNKSKLKVKIAQKLHSIALRVQKLLHVDRTKGRQYWFGANWFSITDDLARHVLSVEKEIFDRVIKVEGFELDIVNNRDNIQVLKNELLSEKNRALSAEKVLSEDMTTLATKVSDNEGKISLISVSLDNEVSIRESKEEELFAKIDNNTIKINSEIERAKNAGIKAMHIKDEDLLINTLKEEKIDLIVLAGYLAIVSDKLINLYENKIINIHPSLIPSFCGSGFYGIHVHEHAFNRGVKVSGATVHFVSNVVDGGPIILQRAIDISDCNSPEEIQLKILYNIEHKILVEAVKLYCDDKLKIENERVIIK